MKQSGVTLLRRLDRAAPQRMFAPRLAISERYVRCDIDDSAANRLHGCDTKNAQFLPTDELLDVAARTAQLLRDRPDPDALHAAALLDLGSPGGSGNSLDRSISYLMVAASSRWSADAATDLSAAYIVRAERTHHAQDLVSAMESAARATALEPSQAAARFNLALALDRLGVHEQAAEEWGRAAALDGRSSWGDEARRRRTRLLANDLSPAEAQASSVGVSEYAHSYPQEAEEFAWDVLLDRWASDVLEGATTDAETELARADTIARILAVADSNRSLVDAIATIHTREPRSVRTIAAVQHAYAVGRADYKRSAYATGDSAFERASESVDAPPVLRHLAILGRASVLNYLGRYGDAETLARGVADAEDSGRHPSVAGRAHWIVATLTLRRGAYEEALRESRVAVDCFIRSHERANLGGVRSLMSDIYFAVGDADDGYATARDALEALRLYPRAIQRHNELFSMTKHAAADGEYFAALEFANADVSVAATTSELAQVEARLSRARVRIAMGASSEAVSDIARARAMVERWPAGEARAWFRTELAQVDGQALLHDDPARAIQAIDTVVEFFALRENALRLLPGLVARAEAELALKRARAADADLERAVALLEREHMSLSRLDYRVSLLDGARTVFDRLVGEKAATGDPAVALSYLERGRAALAARPTQYKRARFRMPPHVVGVEYALFADTLLAWTVNGSDVRLTRTIVQRARLLKAVEHVQSALELRTGDESTHSELRWLYEQLLRPIVAQMGPARTSLVIVTDGELAATPFAALIDASTNRYLVEDHPISFASRLGESRRAESLVRNPTVLVVVGQSSHGGAGEWAPLPGAAEEAREVRQLYTRGRIVPGDSARTAEVQQLLGTTPVVHFAGHAIFDDVHPEQSYLVIEEDSGPSGRLTAAAMAGLDLRRVRLLVLSGCQTLAARPGHSGGFAGFAGAALSAGAGGVLGSLWRVDDQLTRTLLVAFHRAFVASSDGPSSLRDAQLQMMHSQDEELQSPATWASFRYFGG